jgi:hypothetical protein
LTGLFSRQADYVDSKIKRQLGYLPAFDLETGLAQTVPWLQLHEIIPGGDGCREAETCRHAVEKRRPTLTHARSAHEESVT